MGLDQPSRGAGLTNPHGRGVVVIVLALGLVFRAAVEGVDDVIGREGGVRREDANLKVAELVRLELAVFQADQQGVDCLDVIIHFNEVFGEEASHSGEVAFGHCCPEMLLEVDDLDRSRSWGGGLRRQGCGECKKKEEDGTHETIVASRVPFGSSARTSSVETRLFGGCGWCAYFTDRGVNDGVEELAVIAARFGLDVFAGTLTGCGVVGKSETASLSRDLRELLDDVEEGSFIAAGELPAVGNGTSEDLLGRPVVRSSGVGRRRNGDIRLRLWGRGLLLCGRGESRGGESEAEGNFIDWAHDRSFFLEG
jgi:hypothetical protein